MRTLASGVCLLAARAGMAAGLLGLFGLGRLAFESWQSPPFPLWLLALTCGVALVGGFIGWRHASGKIAFAAAWLLVGAAVAVPLAGWLIGLLMPAGWD